MNIASRILLASALLSGSAATMAQDAVPNRLVVWEASGQYKGYLTSRVDSIVFYSETREVNSTIQVTSVDETTCEFTSTKTEGASYLELAVVTDNVASYLTDEAAAANYVVQNTLGEIYDQTFTGMISGLSPGSNYVIMTAAIDRYGIACGVGRAAFTTAKAAIIGTPQVTAEVTEVTTKGFTVQFTPNEYVVSYAYVAGEKGQWQQQYEQWGPMFGFTNFGDMIMAWGAPAAGPSSFTWDDFAPNTEYEVLIQAIDENGNYPDYQTLAITTAVNGGEGPAEIHITVGDFGEENGKYYQEVIYEPNENTAVFYDILVPQSTWDELGAEGIKGYLVQYDQEKYYPMYSTDDAYWNADPKTTYHACAMGKNANGEWGEMADVVFTTPSGGSKGAPARQPMLPQRRTSKASHPRAVAPTPFKMSPMR